jgi:hypothetical protein
MLRSPQLDGVPGRLSQDSRVLAPRGSPAAESMVTMRLLPPASLPYRLTPYKYI